MNAAHKANLIVIIIWAWPQNVFAPCDVRNCSFSLCRWWRWSPDWYWQQNQWRDNGSPQQGPWKVRVSLMCVTQNCRIGLSEPDSWSTHLLHTGVVSFYVYLFVVLLSFIPHVWELGLCRPITCIVFFTAFQGSTCKFNVLWCEFPCTWVEVGGNSNLLVEVHKLHEFSGCCRRVSPFQLSFPCLIFALH